MAYRSADVAAASPLTTGVVFAAPKGTALPTNATATLNVAFQNLGRAGEEGLTPSGDDATQNEFRDWSGDVVTTNTESKSVTKFDFVLLGTFEPEVQKLVHGTGNVTVTAAVTGTSGTKLAILEKGDDITPRALVFDMLYESKRMRIVVPDGKITVQDRAFTRNELTGYNCTVTCRPDSSGVRTYRYFENDDL